MEQLGGKKIVVDKMWANRSTNEKERLFKEHLKIDQIPKECISNKNNLYLLQIGKVKHFGEGCACPMGGLSKDFLDNLHLELKNIAIIDTEAGIEHLGRAIEKSVDLILVILDPSYESILLSEKIYDMAAENDKAVHYILNKIDKVTSKKILDRVKKTLLVGVIPFNESIQEKG